MMHYNRQPLIGDKHPWDHLFINIEKENLGSYRPNPIINISGSTALHRHEITFITGTSNCRAHAIAKMLTAAVINGNYPFAQALQVAQLEGDDEEETQSSSKNTGGKVLWIDSVHSFYTLCGFIDDLKSNFNVNNDNFRCMCLDDIGTFNECDERVHAEIIKAIREFKPDLVVIDDLDHLTPECGWMRADNFYLAIRETLDHYDTALLCVAYNLIGREKSTAGFIGKRLFPIANNVFRVTNRGLMAVLNRVKGITCDDQFQFAFNINSRNFPQEVIINKEDEELENQLLEKNTVQDIITTVIPKNEAISPDELLERLNKRAAELNRFNRNRHLIGKALACGIINRNDDGKYAINNELYKNGNDFNKDDFLNGLFDKCVDKFKKINTIPKIPKNTEPISLTFINEPPRPS